VVKAPMPTLVPQRRRTWFDNFYGNARLFCSAALKLRLKDYSSFLIMKLFGYGPVSSAEAA
jgi:hypothetical protein